MSTSDKVANSTREMKGHVEETAGRVFGDDELVVRGKSDKLAAQTKKTAAQAGDAAKRVGLRLKERAIDKITEFHQRLHEAAAEAERKADKATTDKSETGSTAERSTARGAMDASDAGSAGTGSTTTGTVSSSDTTGSGTDTMP